MAKKKDKPQVINNIKEIKLEIDCDELAEAIVRAQKKSEEIIEEKDDGDIGFWTSIWYIIRNKKKTNGDLLAASMSMLMSLVFNILALAFAIVGGILVFYFFKTVWDFFVERLNWDLIPYAMIYASFGCASALLGLLMRGIANDISWENNKNYTVSVFSGIVSFAALIVALVALFKGVG